MEGLIRDPVIGTLILIVIIYILLRTTGYDIKELFTSEGFKRIYTNDPWVIYLCLAILAYGSYSIYLRLCKLWCDCNNERFESGSETKSEETVISIKINPRFSNEVSKSYGLMDFKEFYEKYILTNQDNVFMLFRTEIGGIKYYLIMESFKFDNQLFRTVNAFQSKQEAERPFICNIDGNDEKLVGPYLIREDLIESKYKQFLQSNKSLIEKELNVKKGLDLLNKEENVNKDYAEIRKYLNEKLPNMKDQLTDETLDKIIKSISQLTDQQILDTFRTYGIDAENTKEIMRKITYILGRTDTERYLQKSLYPRYVHHLNVIQTLNSNIDIYNLSLNKNNNGSGKDICYRIGGYIEEQLTDPLTGTKTEYIVSGSKSFSPFTIVRKDKSIGNNMKIIEKNKNNDRRYLCGIQTSTYDKYTDIYIESNKLNLSETEGKRYDSRLREHDKIMLVGENNTEIRNIDNDVSMYILGDYTNQNGKIVKNKKFYFGYLDEFTDPYLKNNTTDPYYNKDSIYYKKPRYYTIGMIPEDYTECQNDKHGNIDKKCKGILYENGIDYSDTKRIRFDVATIKLNPY